MVTTTEMLLVEQDPRPLLTLNETCAPAAKLGAHVSWSSFSGPAYGAGDAGGVRAGQADQLLRTCPASG